MDKKIRTKIENMDLERTIKEIELKDTVDALLEKQIEDDFEKARIIEIKSLEDDDDFETAEENAKILLSGAA